MKESKKSNLLFPNQSITVKKIIHFPITKIIVGILVVAGSVALGEWISKLLLDKIQIQGDFKNLIIAIVDAFTALLSYVLLFKFYEKRKITELS
jgi:CAAX protease family protein